MKRAPPRVAPVASTALHERALPATAEALAIARTMLEGFNRHYALFRDCARAAKRHFESGNWLAIQHLGRDRIDFYDRRVAETVERIRRDLASAGLDRTSDALWEEMKLHYIGLLIGHKQPECAETFFNSVSVQILERDYFNNRFIFVRPAISTEHIEADPPTYKSYYPLQQGLRQAVIDIVLDMRLEQPFADFRRDLANLLAAFRKRFPRPFRLEANHQVQVLQSPFFRNQTAYVVGRIINGPHVYPFVVAVKHDGEHKLRLDALLTSERDLGVLFSANRAYFLVDMEVPSAYVDFLRSMVPDKTPAELYTMVGLQKQGKNLFYRDFLHHLRHSRDKFVIAPGIRGLVMSVFTLPSYPYVFKVIRDRIATSKDTDRERVKQKYTLVKRHDRVGRMTDVLEYSQVAFPRERFSDELLAELTATAPSVIEVDADRVIVRHLYIERRMTPLNMHLEACDDAKRQHALREYGDAIRDLAAVNIFPGDLLFKNFGVTRYGRVVFYDYDEIEYLTDCTFRQIPSRPAGQDEMSDEVWYPVGPHDVFPEEFATFLLTDPRIRAAFLAFHADLLTAQWWQARQADVAAGKLTEVLSYPDSARFPAPSTTRGTVAATEAAHDQVR